MHAQHSTAGLHVVPIDTKRQLKQSVHLEDLAECLYETAALCDVTTDDRGWSRLDSQTKAQYRYQATAALNGLSHWKRHEAELRARQHVADLPHIGKAFHLLPGIVQRQIVFTVQCAVNTYLRCLEGVFQPLPARLANELEPREDE